MAMPGILLVLVLVPLLFASTKDPSSRMKDLRRGPEDCELENFPARHNEGAWPGKAKGRELENFSRIVRQRHFQRHFLRHSPASVDSIFAISWRRRV